MTEAIDALGESKDVHAIEPLLNLLGENIFPERLVSKVKSRASIALSNIGEKAVPMLINALADVQKDPERSYWVIDALGLTKDKRAIEPLINILNSESLINTRYIPYRAIRESAIVALGRIGDSKALEPLISTFQKLTPLSGYLYFATIEALERIGGKKSLDILEEALANLTPESGYFHDVSNTIKRMRVKQSSSK